jgi:glycosyltransferase involved in cell wall biosynthesis
MSAHPPSANESLPPPASGRALRIAQVAPVAMPVRPGEGDSVEQLVSLLTEELVRRGHDVTLYAAGDSLTSARLRAVHARGYHEEEDLWDWQLFESMHAAHAFEHAGDHDLIHAHDYGFAVPFAPLVDTPLIETPHVDPAPEVLGAYRRRPDLQVVAVSDFQRGRLGARENVTVIPHGIDVHAFPFSERGGDYLLFLGRMIADKGPSEAIRIAQAAGMPLVLAGPAQDGYDIGAERAIDGKAIRYVGAVSAQERNRLLAGAAALVFPLLYPEPFGLVLIEAMACGTPVVASALGAVPEIVDVGVTGLTATSWEGLAELVPAAAALDRAAVRRTAEERWDFRRVVDDHEALYRRVVAGGAGT